MKKIKRNLSGIYFRVKDKKTGKFDTIVFEDLTKEQQDEQMNDQSEDWLKRMVKRLANTLNDIGEKFNIEY